MCAPEERPLPIELARSAGAMQVLKDALEVFHALVGKMTSAADAINDQTVSPGAIYS
jgi:hypothetical protein